MIDNPLKYTLPSMDLLKMQWKLQHMVGTKGAVEAIDLTDERIPLNLIMEQN
jgi:hypothetical protein